MKVFLCVALLVVVLENSGVQGGWFDVKPTHKELHVVLPLKKDKEIASKFEGQLDDAWQYIKSERTRGCKEDDEKKEEPVMVYDIILEESSKTNECIDKLKKFMKKHASKGKMYWRGAVELLD